MNISPTQITKWRQCQRLYAYEYVEGQRPPPSARQQFGTDMHKQLERWLRTGTPPDQSPAGRTAAQGIRPEVLPAPSGALLVEHNIVIPGVHGGVDIAGFADLVEPPTLLRRWPLVVDHKSTSSLQWAKTPADLATDPQALIYALWAMLAFTVPTCEIRWVYYVASNPRSGSRKPAGCRPVGGIFRAADPAYQAQIQELADDCWRMSEVRRLGVRAAQLPPSPQSCSAFEGCVHTERCALSPHDKITSFFG